MPLRQYHPDELCYIHVNYLFRVLNYQTALKQYRILVFNSIFLTDR